jgi:hypothetical protein
LRTIEIVPKHSSEKNNSGSGHEGALRSAEHAHGIPKYRRIGGERRKFTGERTLHLRAFLGVELSAVEVEEDKLGGSE